MNLDIIAPAFYPDEIYIRYFLESAKRHGISVKCYGMGEPFKHWIDTHISRCINFLDSLSSTHVLFTDSIDVLFLASAEEIWMNYLAMGAPSIMTAVERSGLNFGGWIAERKTMTYALHLLGRDFSGSDPQDRWRRAVSEWENKIPVVPDARHRIFQVVDGSNLVAYINIKNGNGDMKAARIYNADTESLPCLLHIAGGGKEERMAPFLKTLGYER